MRNEWLKTLCAHIDGIAFFASCCFIGLLLNSNSKLQAELNQNNTVMSLKMEALEVEAKSSNQLAELRGLQIKQLNETVQQQNEAIATLKDTFEQRNKLEDQKREAQSDDIKTILSEVKKRTGGVVSSDVRNAIERLRKDEQ